MGGGCWDPRRNFLKSLVVVSFSVVDVRMVVMVVMVVIVVMVVRMVRMVVIFRCVLVSLLSQYECCFLKILSLEVAIPVDSFISPSN